ncbi:hypothetical protein FACS189475_07930 [Betaproteobacteria bacterium]|nr:hypothetical protein FACS189475_07930 [Betaproteobacteria bacterium]
MSTDTITHDVTEVSLIKLAERATHGLSYEKNVVCPGFPPDIDRRRSDGDSKDFNPAEEKRSGHDRRGSGS